MTRRLPSFGSVARPICVRDETIYCDSDPGLHETNQSGRTAAMQTTLPALSEQQLPWVPEHTCRVPHRDVRLKAFDTVELIGDMTYQTYWDERNGDFFLIRGIFHNLQNDDIKLVGQRIRRNCYFAGMLSDQDDINEVCLLHAPPPKSRQLSLSAGLEEVPLSQVFKVRRLLFTNLPSSFLLSTDRNEQEQNAQATKTSERHHSGSGLLVCRWLFSSPHPITDIESAKLDQGALKRLTMNECRAYGNGDHGFASSDDQLLEDLLGYLPSFPSPGKKRQFFDAFCGAGGISEGARRAGLSVSVANDIDSNACATYRLNHPNTDLYQAPIDQSIIVAFPDGHNRRIEVAHVSPVCKTYSPLHTVPGRDDEKNQATLFCVGHLLKTVRPRVLSLEQTSGLVTHHRPFFRELIYMITSAGYSARWKIVHLDEYGGAQKRKRLIIFASCPGGTLPEFPVPSHGPRSATKWPFTTVPQALAPLRTGRNITHHDERDAERRYRKSRQPKIPAQVNGPLRYCITTQGPEESHPTEKRYFTIRDTALLQGFPLSYLFPPNQTLGALMTQIGNAVPAVAAEELFREILRTLDQEDLERANRTNGA